MSDRFYQRTLYWGKILGCIGYLNNKNKPGLLFCADVEKDFDSINHDFMFKCLEKYLNLKIILDILSYNRISCF